jgi:hypothetical protein
MWGHYQNAYLDLDTASAENGPTREVYSQIRWVLLHGSVPDSQSSLKTWEFFHTTIHFACRYMEDWKAHNDGSVAVGLLEGPGE